MNNLIKFIKSLFFLEILKGLTITGKKLSKKPITVQYPEEKLHYQPGLGDCMRSENILMARKDV